MHSLDLFQSLSEMCVRVRSSSLCLGINRFTNVF